MNLFSRNLKTRYEGGCKPVHPIGKTFGNSPEAVLAKEELLDRSLTATLFMPAWAYGELGQQRSCQVVTTKNVVVNVEKRADGVGTGGRVVAVLQAQEHPK